MNDIPQGEIRTIEEIEADLALPALPAETEVYDHLEEGSEIDKIVRGNDRAMHEVYKGGVVEAEEKAAQVNLLKSRAKRLEEHSVLDPLTKLRNRRAFNEAFPSAIDRALRRIREAEDKKKEGKELEPPSLAFLIFDLDNFKEVNDAYGHPAGDAVLKQFSRLLEEQCRDSEKPFRWGGEEFAVITDSPDLPAAIKFAERVRKAVEEAEFELPNGQKIKKTTSVGVTSMKHFNGKVTKDTADMLMEKADEALYAAKKGGRNVTMAAVKDGSFIKANEIIET
jgi:diguanylate cyclase (GGDEF)-like protein